MHAYNGVLIILGLACFFLNFVFCASVKVKLTVPLLCVCVHSAWKGCPQNDLYCVGWYIKPYSLTHSLFVCGRRKVRTKTTGRRQRSQPLLRVMAPVTSDLMSLISTMRLLIQLLMTLSKATLSPGIVTASRLTDEEKTETVGGTMMIETAKPVRPRDDGQSAIEESGNIDRTASGVETVNLDVGRGIAMIDMVLTTVGNVIEVVRETEAVRGESMTTAATDILISRRVPPIPGARNEVAPGHGKTQSRVRVEMTHPAADTEAVTGEFFSLCLFSIYILAVFLIFSDGLFR